METTVWLPMLTASVVFSSGVLILEEASCLLWGHSIGPLEKSVRGVRTLSQQTALIHQARKCTKGKQILPPQLSLEMTAASRETLSQNHPVTSLPDLSFTETETVSAYCSKSPNLGVISYLPVPSNTKARTISFGAKHFTCLFKSSFQFLIF